MNIPYNIFGLNTSYEDLDVLQCANHIMFIIESGPYIMSLKTQVKFFLHNN